MKLVRNLTDLVPIWRDRAATLGLTHAQIDSISGMPDGYFGKLVCGMKSPGPKAVEAYNGTFGIRFVCEDDPEQIARVKSRWIKRKRPMKKEALAAVLKPEETQKTLEQMTIKEKLQMWGRMGGKRGGKRRMKTMSRRARQRIATHAARMRWSRQVTP